jgi:hypothetical protein
MSPSNTRKTVSGSADSTRRGRFRYWRRGRYLAALIVAPIVRVVAFHNSLSTAPFGLHATAVGRQPRSV